MPDERKHAAELTAAIDAALALIDIPSSWPASAKAERARKALRTALIAAHDALKGSG
jgi:hypothetical protein